MPVCCCASPAIPPRGCGRSRPALGITEPSAQAIITDLTDAGYVAKQKAGRRIRYQIQAHLPLPGADGRQRTAGGLADLLAEPGAMPRAEPGRS